MEDIYVVEIGDKNEDSQVENLWQQLSEAQAYVQAKIGGDSDYTRNKDKENDTVLGYWESKDQYICIRVTVVD